MLTALSAYSVFAEDTTVTGKIVIEGDNTVGIDLGHQKIATIETDMDAAGAATEAKLRKQAGKTVTLHGNLREKMIKGTSDMYLLFHVQSGS